MTSSTPSLVAVSPSSANASTCELRCFSGSANGSKPGWASRQAARLPGAGRNRGMTVTILSLYSTLRRCSKGGSGLQEAPGVPHSDISIVADDSDGWSGTDRKVDRDRDGVDDRAEVPATTRASVPVLAVRQVCSPVSGCSRSPAFPRSSLPAGSRQRRLAPRPGCDGRHRRSLDGGRRWNEDAHAYAEGVRRGGTLVSSRCRTRIARA